MGHGFPLSKQFSYKKWLRRVLDPTTQVPLKWQENTNMTPLFVSSNNIACGPCQAKLCHRMSVVNLIAPDPFQFETQLRRHYILDSRKNFPGPDVALLPSSWTHTHQLQHQQYPKASSRPSCIISVQTVASTPPWCIIVAACSMRLASASFSPLSACVKRWFRCVRKSSIN
jgi:hypothetical protein